MTQVHLYNGQPYTNQEQLDELRAQDILQQKAKDKMIAQGKENIENTDAVKKKEKEVEVKVKKVKEVKAPKEEVKA